VRLRDFDMTAREHEITAITHIHESIRLDEKEDDE
jgi:hypothetical protein